MPGFRNHYYGPKQRKREEIGDDTLAMKPHVRLFIDSHARGVLLTCKNVSYDHRHSIGTRRPKHHDFSEFKDGPANLRMKVYTFIHDL